MELIIILLFLAVIAAVVYSAYIPNELQLLAQKAGFGKTSLRYLILKLNKLPVKYLFEENEKLQNNNIEIDFDKLKKIYTTDPIKFKNTVQVLLQAAKSKVQISVDEILSFNIDKKNADRFFTILKYADQEYLSSQKGDILKLVESDLDILEFLELYKKIKQYHLNVFDNTTTAEDLKIIKSLIANLEKCDEYSIRFSFLKNDNKPWISKLDFTEDLLSIQENPLPITVAELIDLYNRNINTKDYINSIQTLSKYPDINFDMNHVKEYFLSGGNFSKVVNAYEFARNNQVMLSIDEIIQIEKNQNEQFDKRIEQLIIPFEIEFKEIRPVLLKDGIKLSLIPVLKMRRKISSQNPANSEKQLKHKLNEIITTLLQTYEHYDSVSKNLNNISSDIYNKLESDQDAVYHSDFEILFVSIQDINIDTDKFSEIKRIETEEQIKKEKLKLIESKRKYNEHLSKAFEEGKISIKDYQKEKYIFNSDDDGDLPYHNNSNKLD